MSDVEESLRDIARHLDRCAEELHRVNTSVQDMVMTLNLGLEEIQKGESSDNTAETEARDMERILQRIVDALRRVYPPETRT